MSEPWYIECPHCGGGIRCKIFRHAIYKDGKPFSPHTSEDAVKLDQIYGCGKPLGQG